MPITAGSKFPRTLPSTLVVHTQVTFELSTV